MATTQVRYATIARLKALFETNSAGAVLLSLGWPGSDNHPQELAYVVRNDGQHSILAYSPRTPRQDDFNIHIEVAAEADGQTDDQAYQRAEQIFAFFENAVADNPKNLGTVDGLLKCEINRVDGPFVIGTNKGWKGYLNFDLACMAHYL